MLIHGWIRIRLQKLIQKVNLHPTNITHIVKIFSVSVFGATLPNPTEVKDVNVKYSAVIYRDCKM